MSRKIILSKSKTKGKRFRVEMIGFGDMKDHMHNFGSDVGKTFIDHSDEKKKSAWNSDSLKQNIKILAKKLNAIIVNRI